MIDARRAFPVVLIYIVAASFLAGCRTVPPQLTPRAAPLPSVGQYKGRIQGEDTELRRFRLLLFAALPDRAHAEILSPLGNTQMILDGGQGSLAVTFVADGVSYVGPASLTAIDRILGVPLTLEQLVRALLIGEIGNDEVELTRTGAANSLPELLQIRTGSASLELKLQRLRPAPAAAEELGTGTPPPGTDILPIEDLGHEP